MTPKPVTGIRVDDVLGPYRTPSPPVVSPSRKSSSASWGAYLVTGVLCGVMGTVVGSVVGGTAYPGPGMFQDTVTSDLRTAARIIRENTPSNKHSCASVVREGACHVLVSAPCSVSGTATAVTTGWNSSAIRDLGGEVIARPGGPVNNFFRAIDPLVNACSSNTLNPPAIDRAASEVTRISGPAASALESAADTIDREVNARSDLRLVFKVVGAVLGLLASMLSMRKLNRVIREDVERMRVADQNPFASKPESQTSQLDFVPRDASIDSSQSQRTVNQ